MTHSKLISWILISKVFIACAILFSGIGLMPDEAQYWTWSQDLSYGYYSKPCGIAWQIAFGCFLFGDTEFGVRFGGQLLSFFLSIGVYQLASYCGLDKKKAFWSAITFSLCPLGLFSGFFATTDCAYVLFWAVVTAIFAKDLTQNRPISFGAIGAVIAIGALWKWPLYAAWIPILIFSAKEKHFSFAKALFGIVISLLGAIPSFIWNFQYDFPTFHHIFASLNSGSVSAGESNANPFSFIGAQVALVSPIIFVLLVRQFICCKSEEKALRFCWWTTLLFLSVMLLLSCFKKVQGNWAVAAYPTAFVILMSGNTSKAFMRWLQVGISLSVLLVTFLVSFPQCRINPLKQGLGWHEIEKVLTTVGYDPQSEFLFSDRYQWTSILSFYGPEKKRAFFLNLHDLRKNQFCYWPSMQEKCVGKDGWFVAFVEGKEAVQRAVWATQSIKTKLDTYFDEVTALQPVSIAGEGTKMAILLYCHSYNGTLPEPSQKY